ncbi:MAG: hypothetical protein KKF68_00095 [Nanoarchaeota archaeon]|nr:hypothetical protein [Nanoarchaeota archaeon]
MGLRQKLIAGAGACTLAVTTTLLSGCGSMTQRERTEILGLAAFGLPGYALARLSNQEQEEQQRKPQKQEERAFFTYGFDKDLNGDGILSPDEFFEMGKKIFDLRTEMMSVGFFKEDYEGPVLFRAFTKSGKEIGRNIRINSKGRCLVTYTGPGTEGDDFMEKIKKQGPGKYDVTATILKNGETYKLELEITNK